MTCVGRLVPWGVFCHGMFCAVGRLEMGRFESRTFCCGTFSDGTFSDGTFLEWDVSRAGPFVCAPTGQVGCSGQSMENLGDYNNCNIIDYYMNIFKLYLYINTILIFS